MSAEDVRFRQARFDDLEAIVRVFMGDGEGGHGDAWNEETRPAYEEAMRRVLASEANTLFVAERGGEVIGTIQVTIIPGLVSRGRTRAKLESVHVRPEWRGRGVGEAMVRAALAFAKARGAGIVELSSNKKRVAAHRFYERLGFARSHEGFKLLL
jgi:ribosomal protein S18 acetylase RimI-like enzyme